MERRNANNAPDEFNDELLFPGKHYNPRLANGCPDAF
jgi:hypothetical protein